MEAPQSPASSSGDSAIEHQTQQPLQVALDWCAALEAAEAQVKDGEYAQAINTYSELLRRSDIEGGAAAAPGRHAALLLARSAAYAQLSQHLRGIPAAQSERSAILAPDPCHLAALAAQDADAVLALRPACPEALLHKGHSLFLQERYSQAETAYRAGLDLQPTHQALRSRLAELHAALAGSACGASGCSDDSGVRVAPRCRQLFGEADEEVDCPICSRMLYDPVTTPCGHTFCAACFRRSMDHACRCPLCRTVLHVGCELPVTRVLASLLEKCYPADYAARREEERLALCSAADQAPLPLFVMTLLLPGQSMALNIFEPRYRLLVRRAMAGNRRFGMAAVDGRHELCEVACEAEIVECRPLLDGRFYVEVLGRRRCRLKETWEMDGYRVARPEYFGDVAPEPDSEAAAALREAAGEVERLADAWAERLRRLSQTHRGIAEMLQRAGGKPACGGAEALSFWVARLVCPLMDQGEPGLVRQLMATCCTAERLRTEKELLEQFSRVQPSQCCIM